MAEKEANITMSINELEDHSGVEVAGRGILHLTVLMESMRREGYEFQVGRPRVIYHKDENGKLLEPYEEAVVETPAEYAGKVIEQFGFVGSMALLALYGALIYVSMRIARNSNDLFGTLIVMCVVGMWLFQILENIGMDCGLMPITGIPLPFVSYGSTGMIMSFMALGLIGSVYRGSNIDKKKEGRL